jgi:hypothetical protein
MSDNKFCGSYVNCEWCHSDWINMARPRIVSGGGVLERDNLEVFIGSGT